MAGKYIFGFFRRRRVAVDPADLRLQLKGMGVWLLLMILLHIFAMMWLEGMSAWDGLWLTATTVMTVGYGDLSAKTQAGRAATLLLMYAGGIFVLAKAVADYAEWRSTVRERQAGGAWDWKMKDHLLLVGEPSGDATQHVARLVDQVRLHPAWAEVEVLMLTRAFGDGRIAGVLAERGLVHVAGAAADPRALDKAHPESARAVLVFASSETDREADARVLDTVMRLRERSATVPVVAECVEHGDRARLQKAGATQTIRPMHGYPEMAARALVSPGAEALIENLFTAEGDECLRVELGQAWRGPWNELLLRVVQAGIGTPVGYAAADGSVVASPVGREVEAVSIFLIVCDERQRNAEQDVRAALRG